MNYSDFLPNPTAFLALTSLSPEQFHALLIPFSTAVDDYFEAKTFSGKRRLNKYSPRSHKGLLSHEQKLFFILVFLKQNPIQPFLAATFGLSQEMTNKWIKMLLPIIQKILTPFLDTQTQTIHNQDEIIIDATERPVQRPVYEQQDFFFR